METLKNQRKQAGVTKSPPGRPGFVGGIVDYEEPAVKGGVDPVVTAAVAAFGFVYVHPSEDGNGRIHRWLVHHIVASAGYNPPGVVFPVSAAILRGMGSYLQVLESYSQPLLEQIDWRPTEQNNVEV